MSIRFLDLKTPKNDDGYINLAEYKKLIQKIIEAKTSDGLINIASEYNLNISSNKYPRLNFSISIDEMNIIETYFSYDNDGELIIDQSKLDPISKLFFAMIWKQGDIQKLKTIIKGIKEADNPSKEEKNGLVFYSFGNHLGNPGNNPIVDQHVVRAVKLFNDNSENISTIRKLRTITNKDRLEYLEFIQNFKNRDTEYRYLLDLLLFNIGKLIKLT